MNEPLDIAFEATEPRRSLVRPRPDFEADVELEIFYIWELYVRVDCFEVTIEIARLRVELIVVVEDHFGLSRLHEPRVVFGLLEVEQLLPGALFVVKATFTVVAHSF